MKAEVEKSVEGHCLAVGIGAMVEEEIPLNPSGNLLALCQF